MDLSQYREQIDQIDDELIQLFARRMETAAQIAQWKRQAGKPVMDAGRERAKLLDVMNKCPAEFKDYAVSLYSLLFELSRSYQHRILDSSSTLTEQISAAIAHTAPLFPKTASVACQGVEGAYSQLACEKLFRLPNIFYFNSFDAVFSAIEKGLCRYGIIPLENSTAGSVNKVYDLMMRHNFRIVRSVRLKVDHNLLVKPGTKLEDIQEIYSHEQAINQCARYLQKFSGVKIIPCENTAMAAKYVSEAGGGAAALSSRSCAKLYGLTCLEESVQDQGNNYTRFICISKNLEIYPGADKTSIMMILPHKPGALYKVLARLYTLGINVTKLESRPIPDREFEFMFYFDLETSIYSEAFVQLMCELEDFCEEFKYLGSYSEVV